MDTYLATGPLLHPLRDGLIFEVIVSNNVGRSQALQVLLNVGEVIPTKSRVRNGP